MSGIMFAKTNSKSNLAASSVSKLDSKIPVPASPKPLRRQSSLRLKGEKTKFPNNDEGGSTTAGRFSNIRQQSTPAPPQSAGDGVLLRRRSFMDQGPQTKRPDSVRVRAAGENSKSPARGPATPQSPARIRSLSLSLSNTRLQSPRSPRSGTIAQSSPSNPGKKFSSNHLDTWDTDSISSIGSSVTSCDHASVARNGTTFSGRSMKYVFHCNQHAGATGEDYLTPTQRAQRQVKKLKFLLQQAKRDLEDKDSDVLKLTKEVVELRLYKAALGSPEDRSNSSDAITVRENTSEENTPEDLVDKSVSNHITGESNHSCADSGHYEDCTNSSVHSKDSVLFDDHRSPLRSYRNVADTSEKMTLTDFGLLDQDEEHNKLILEYEKRLQELVKMHEEESYQMKQKHNDKVEELLQRITEINNRYWQLVPELESAKERIKELEAQLEEASKKLEEQEKTAREAYEKMYSQGKEAARLEREKTVMELAHQNPSRISVPELLQELQVTKNELESVRAMYRQLMEAKSKNKIDPEITLQFLKSAVYYFLTDKENSQGHLKAIQSILGFSQNEITNIDKAWFTTY